MLEIYTKKLNKHLNPQKAVQNTEIPAKVLKERADIFSAYTCEFVNETVRSGKFPSILKHGNITPVFKKDPAESKENYRPYDFHGLIIIKIPRWI